MVSDYEYFIGDSFFTNDNLLNADFQNIQNIVNSAQGNQITDTNLAINKDFIFSGNNPLLKSVVEGQNFDELTKNNKVITNKKTQGYLGQLNPLVVTETDGIVSKYIFSTDYKAMAREKQNQNYSSMSGGLGVNYSDSTILNRNIFSMENFHIKMNADVNNLVLNLREEALITDIETNIQYRVVILDENYDYNFEIIGGTDSISSNDILISQNFALANKIKVGKDIKVAGVNFKVKGYATDVLTYYPLVDPEVPISDPNTGAIIYTTKSMLQSIKDKGNGSPVIYSNNYYMNYKVNENIISEKQRHDLNRFQGFLMNGSDVINKSVAAITNPEETVSSSLNNINGLKMFSDTPIMSRILDMNARTLSMGMFEKIYGYLLHTSVNPQSGIEIGSGQHNVSIRSDLISQAGSVLNEGVPQFNASLNSENYTPGKETLATTADFKNTYSSVKFTGLKSNQNSYMLDEVGSSKVFFDDFYELKKLESLIQYGIGPQEDIIIDGQKVYDSQTKVVTIPMVTNLKNKEKLEKYMNDMFPYPSGSGLHVGHPKGYTATDVFARMRKLQGYDVLHPIGYDAFGLPAEQYAIKTGNDPREFTAKNIDIFRAQLKTLGFSYDYDKEVNTRVTIQFDVKGTNENIEVFTTRADTIFGVSYITLAPEHPMVLNLTSDKLKNEVLEYIEVTKSKTDIERQDDSKEKTGFFIESKDQTKAFVGEAKHVNSEFLNGLDRVESIKIILEKLEKEKKVPTPEPFQKLINQGMILADNGEKMSKSKGNVINPDEIVESHGADTLRLYEMFMGPLEASLP
ncbi:hypothetical protein FQR65_LT17086 [Abscondita terminalis]|nr:hypothetical protein FQR65_LT17086 [Abscondita terminalis]